MWNLSHHVSSLSEAAVPKGYLLEKEVVDDFRNRGKESRKNGNNTKTYRGENSEA
jgi:hypothetical protein